MARKHGLSSGPVLNKNGSYQATYLSRQATLGTYFAKSRSLVPSISIFVLHAVQKRQRCNLVQLFWIYFPAPVTETQKAQILKINPIRGPAALKNFTNDPNASRENHVPAKMWATDTESVDGQEAQLMLWPHFWRNAELAEIRHLGKYTMSGNRIIGARTLQERFCDHLEEVRPISWREDFVDFKPINDA